MITIYMPEKYMLIISYSLEILYIISYIFVNTVILKAQES